MTSEEQARDWIRTREAHGGHAYRVTGDPSGGYGSELVCDGSDCHRRNCNYPFKLASLVKLLEQAREAERERARAIVTDCSMRSINCTIGEEQAGVRRVSVAILRRLEAE